MDWYFKRKKLQEDCRSQNFFELNYQTFYSEFNCFQTFSKHFFDENRYFSDEIRTFYSDLKSLLFGWNVLRRDKNLTHYQNCLAKLFLTELQNSFSEKNKNISNKKFVWTKFSKVLFSEISWSFTKVFSQASGASRMFTVTKKPKHLQSRMFTVTKRFWSFLKCKQSLIIQVGPVGWYFFSQHRKSWIGSFRKEILQTWKIVLCH